MRCCDTVIDSLSVKGPVHLDLPVLIPLQRPDVLIVSHLCVMDGMFSKCGQHAWTMLQEIVSQGMQVLAISDHRHTWVFELGFCRITDK